MEKIYGIESRVFCNIKWKNTKCKGNIMEKNFEII